MSHILNANPSSDITYTIYSLLLDLQRKQRFCAVDLGVDSQNESSSQSQQANQSELSCLFVLNACGSLSIKELAEHLDLDQSWLSRLSASLIEKKLVEFNFAENDRRSKILTINKSGLSALNDSEIISAKIVDLTFSDLNKSNLKLLTKYFERFADNLNAKVYKNNSSLNDIGYQLGRISIKTGIWGRGVLETKLNLTQVHILELFQKNSFQPLAVYKFDEYMPYDASTLSRVLMVMEKNNLLAKEKSVSDRRSVLYYPTDLGRQALNELHKNVKKIFSQGLKSYTQEQLEEFVKILELALASKRSELKPELKIVSSNDLDKNASKQIIINVKNNSNKTESAGIIKSGKLTAIIDVEYKKETKKIQSIHLRGLDLDRKLCAQMIEMALMQQQ